EAVFQLAETHYGPVDPREIAPAKPREEMEQHGTRRAELVIPARLPRLSMGYKVPSLVTAEDSRKAYALLVPAGVLSGDSSARLANDLVRQGKLANASASYNLTARQTTLLTLDGTPNNGQALDEVESLLREQIERLKDEPVGEDELDRIKAQVVASEVYQRDSLFYQGMNVGIYETVGLGYEQADRFVEAVQAVTVDDVQAVARKYLDDRRLSVATLEPETDGAEPALPSPTGGIDRVH
ncbi:M16 family metallopeptidase, partial [Guyparkeria sp.]|uniref:M16 family metallopeptidase n=1 Tax=Guyparkeria sp. TaxID=2035736 RepID=UPI0039709D7E